MTSSFDFCNSSQLGFFNRVWESGHSVLLVLVGLVCCCVCCLFLFRCCLGFDYAVCVVIHKLAFSELTGKLSGACPEFYSALM